MPHRATSRQPHLAVHGILAAIATVAVVSAGGSPSARSEEYTIKRAMLSQAPRQGAVSNVIDVHTDAASAGERPIYVRGHVVVKFLPRLSRQTMQVIADAVGGTSLVLPSYADFQYVTIPDDADPVEVAARLNEEPRVIYAEPDAAVYPDFVPNDPYYKYQWNLPKIGMERAWDVNRGGSSRVTVAVLDTGVAYADQGVFARAPDLDSATFVPGYDFVWDDNEPFDLDGHGTHVSGTIAQATDNGVGTAGLAFGVRIMPVKVLYGDWDEAWDAPYPYGSSTVSRGIRFAVEHGAKVINMSLGALGPNTATLDALNYAVQNGVFVAISAGNEGNKGNAATWPASYARDIQGVMAVAALDYDLKRAPYSTYRDYVEIAAPGGDNTSDKNGDGYVDGILQQTLNPTYLDQGVFDRFSYYFYQGTSMASPHVAALAALLIDQGVTAPAAVEAAIKRFASGKPTGGRTDELGYGIIDPRATLRGLGLAR